MLLVADIVTDVVVGCFFVVVVVFFIIVLELFPKVLFCCDHAFGFIVASSIFTGFDLKTTPFNLTISV